MDWSIIKNAYLALSRIFDGFFKFLFNVFGEEE